MSRYYVTQDKDRCIGCLSCEVYCQQNKKLPDGPRLCQVVTLSRRSLRSLPREAYVYLACFHCKEPVCVAACPTGAMHKRKEDGVVAVDAARCVGCKSCLVACPWGAVQWDPASEKVVKCDLCLDRLARGEAPVCVSVCTTGCLKLERLEDEADSPAALA